MAIAVFLFLLKKSPGRKWAYLELSGANMFGIALVIYLITAIVSMACAGIIAGLFRIIQATRKTT